MNPKTKEFQAASNVYARWCSTRAVFFSVSLVFLQFIPFRPTLLPLALKDFTFLRVESTLLLNGFFICVCIWSDLQHDPAGCSVLNLLWRRGGDGGITGVNLEFPLPVTFSYLDASHSDLGTVLCAEDAANTVMEYDRCINSNSLQCNQH